MAKQLYYEDVTVGAEILPLEKVATTVMLAQWAGAVEDFNPLHFDDDFAQKQGVGKRVLHGVLKRAWLVQMLTDWMGDGGFIKKISCYYVKLDYPRFMKGRFQVEDGETWSCKGKVTGKYEEEGAHLIDCQIWVENGQGEVTTPGNATVRLPSRN